MIQRAASDFQIRGKYPNAASELMTIFFTEGNATLDAARSRTLSPKTCSAMEKRSEHPSEGGRGDARLERLGVGQFQMLP